MTLTCSTSCFPCFPTRLPATAAPPHQQCRDPTSELSPIVLFILGLCCFKKPEPQTSREVSLYSSRGGGPQSKFRYTILILVLARPMLRPSLPQTRAPSEQPQPTSRGYIHKRRESVARYCFRSSVMSLDRRSVVRTDKAQQGLGVQRGPSLTVITDSHTGTGGPQWGLGDARGGESGSQSCFTPTNQTRTEA